MIFLINYIEYFTNKKTMFMSRREQSGLPEIIKHTWKKALYLMISLLQNNIESVPEVYVAQVSS